MLKDLNRVSRRFTQSSFHRHNAEKENDNAWRAQTNEYIILRQFHNDNSTGIGMTRLNFDLKIS